jgi:hypothetical protein
LKIPLHHKAAVSLFIYPKRERERERVASSTNHAVPKVSFSARAAIEVFTVTLARGPHRVLSAGAT